MNRRALALTLMRNIPINLARPSEPAGVDLYMVTTAEFRDACTDALAHAEHESGKTVLLLSAPASLHICHSAACRLTDALSGAQAAAATVEAGALVARLWQRAARLAVDIQRAGAVMERRAA